MSSTSLTIADGRGRLHLVPRRQVLEHVGAAEARRLLEAAIEDEGPGARHRLQRLAEDLGPRSPSCLEEALDVVVQAILDGRLVPIQLTEPDRPLDEPQVTNLGELLPPEPPPPLLGGLDGPGSTEPDPTPQQARLSFEVVDDLGQPLEGRFQLTIDGNVTEGALDGTPHQRDDLRPGATATLALETLRPVPPMPADG